MIFESYTNPQKKNIVVKSELKIEFENNTFRCRYTMPKWPVVKKNDVQIKPRIYVLFASEGRRMQSH